MLWTANSVLQVPGIYRWRCSPLNITNNQFSLPNVLDQAAFEDSAAVANGGSIIASNPNIVYVFPVPEILNCRGTVSAIRYCYRVSRSYFETGLHCWPWNTQHSTASGAVVCMISVYSTPTSQICTEKIIQVIFRVKYYLYCCDSMSLNMMDKFHLPASNFAFGIVHASSASLLTFSTSSIGYTVECYSEAKGPVSLPPVEGTVYTFSPSSRASNKQNSTTISVIHK